MKNNKVKVALTCTAPSELTQFNKEYNKGIKEHCERTILFQPTITCVKHSKEAGLACKYLQIKTYRGG